MSGAKLFYSRSVDARTRGAGYAAVVLSACTLAYLFQGARGEGSSPAGGLKHDR